VGKTVYYTTLDNWYLTKYVDIDSTNFDLIIANIKNLLTELQAWKDEKIGFAKREADFQAPCGLIFFTYDKNVADELFSKGYSIAQDEKLLQDLSDNPTNTCDLSDDTVNINDLSDDTANIDAAMNGKEFSSGESDELELSLTDSFVPTSEIEVGKERLQVEVQDHLPDELFDDLEEIELSTVEGDANPSDEEQPLPEDLFQDLAESARATVESGTESEDGEETLPDELFHDLVESAKATVEAKSKPRNDEGK